MTTQRFLTPPIWDDDTLDQNRLVAIEQFIAYRSAEGGSQYRDAFVTNLAKVRGLFEATSNLLTFGTGEALADSPSSIHVARYLSGPPISEDDLDTLAGTSIAKRRRLGRDLGRKAAAVILAALDRERFPWLFETPSRTPTPAELDVAARWTAGLQTAQEVQKGRRKESSARQELAVEELLTSHQFTKVPRKRIEVTGGLDPGTFCRETAVDGMKCDIPIGLHDKRLLLIECKVSNSALNSVKRLNRETAGKAGHWSSRFGVRAITGAVLAGVFRLTNLKTAQQAGVTIFWEHDLAPLASFLANAT